MYIDSNKSIKTAQINQTEFEDLIMGLNVRSYTQNEDTYLGISSSTTLTQLQSLVPLNSLYVLHISSDYATAIRQELENLTILSGELIVLKTIGGAINVYIGRDDDNDTSIVFYRFYSDFHNHGFDKGWQRLQFV